MAQDAKPHRDALTSEKTPESVSKPGDDSDVVYPPMHKVVPIVAALCLCLFLVALVSPPTLSGACLV